jgi:hypothetical protein
MYKSYSAADFAKALSERSLPLDLTTLTGFVDEGESTPEYISFSEGERCAYWTKIPVSLIENVGYLGSRPCLGHLHPYVVLHLKSPAAENKEATAFAQLLMSRSQAATTAETKDVSPTSSSSRTRVRVWGDVNQRRLPEWPADGSVMRIQAMGNIPRRGWFLPGNIDPPSPTAFKTLYLAEDGVQPTTHWRFESVTIGGSYRVYRMRNLANGNLLVYQDHNVGTETSPSRVVEWHVLRCAPGPFESSFYIINYTHNPGYPDYLLAENSLSGPVFSFSVSGEAQSGGYNCWGFQPV